MAISASSALAIAAGTAMHKAAEEALQRGEYTELKGTAGLGQVIREQNAVSERKAALRRSATAATKALVKISQKQIVLGHIQPRWLRKAAEAMLDNGEEVTAERLAELRTFGPPKSFEVK